MGGKIGWSRYRRALASQLTINALPRCARDVDDFNILIPEDDLRIGGRWAPHRDEQPRQGDRKDVDSVAS